MPSPLRTLSWLAVLALACRTTTVPNEPTESTAAPAEPTGDALSNLVWVKNIEFTGARMIRSVS